MNWTARALCLALGVALAPIPAVANPGFHGRASFHRHGQGASVVVVGPSHSFVCPFQVHPFGFKNFVFVPVAPFPTAVFVRPFWFWTGSAWVWVPGHWAW